MKELQATNLSKSMELQIHLGHQSLLLQKGHVGKKIIRVFSILEANSLDRVALCMCTVAKHHPLHHLQMFAVLHGYFLTPLKYSFVQS